LDIKEQTYEEKIKSLTPKRKYNICIPNFRTYFKKYGVLVNIKLKAMKIKVFCLMCFGLICLFCTKDNDINKGKISIDEARDLIKLWIFNEYNPQMNPSLTFSAEEIITDEIWDKMQAQVFTVLTDVPGLHNRGLFIKNKKVFDLGIRNLYGARKLDNLVVSDLDGDNIYELCFPLIHGSGVIRTNIVCYINDLDILTDTSFLFKTNLKLEKENLNKVILKQINDEGEIEIGYLNLVNENSTKKLTIKK
jgi:hypothetical protein